MRSETRSLLGRYRLGRIIGSGGMGTVVLATDELLGRQVALKLLREDLAGDHRCLARFRQEARIAASLSHPGIASVYDFAEEHGRHAIVMELLDGQDLHTILGRDGPMEPAAAAGILAEVAEALDYAHRRGAVHRDVKPANIFLTRSGTVKLTDFGVAHAGGMDQLTTTGAVVGTPDYLSPEQVRGEQSTPRSDVYSLGAVAFQLLTGRPPFSGDNPIAVATARLGALAPSPQAVNPRVSDELDAVVRRAMDPLAENRFASAGAMAPALRAAAGRVRVVPPVTVLGDAPGTVQIPASPATLVDMPGPVPGPASRAGRGSSGGPRARSGRRSRWGWLWAALLIVAMAGLSFDIVATWRRANEPRPVPNWKGFTYDAAAGDARGLGFKVRPAQRSSEAPANQVLGSHPAPGTKLKRGATVTLDVSLGNQFPLDNVISKNVTDAEAILQGQGLSPVVSPQTVPGATAGQVVAQDPAASAAVVKGTTVTLTVTAVPQPSPQPAPQGNPGNQNGGGGLLGGLFNLFGMSGPAPTGAPKHHGGGG
jgi:hypothetical protein